MLSSVHLVGEDEDDLYSGFNEYNPAFDTEVSQLELTKLVKIMEMPFASLTDNSLLSLCKQ